MFIFPTADAFIRQEKMGAIRLAIDAAAKKEHDVRVRILVPVSGLIERRLQVLDAEGRRKSLADMSLISLLDILNTHLNQRLQSW